MKVGERLRLDVEFHGEHVATAYYRWGGLPSMAIQLAGVILESLRKNEEKELIPMVYYALSFTGAAVEPTNQDYLNALGYEFEDVEPMMESGGVIWFSKETKNLSSTDYELKIRLENSTADLENVLYHWKVDEDSEAWRYMDPQRNEMPSTSWEMNLANLNEKDLVELHKVSQKAVSTNSLFTIKGRKELFDSPL